MCENTRGVSDKNSDNDHLLNNDPDFSFSVKCRTGVDDLDSYEDLHNFINIVSTQGGVKRFQIHARKALLGTHESEQYSVVPVCPPDLQMKYKRLDFICQWRNLIKLWWKLSSISCGINRICFANNFKVFVAFLFLRSRLLCCWCNNYRTNLYHLRAIFFNFATPILINHLPCIFITTFITSFPSCFILLILYSFLSLFLQRNLFLSAPDLITNLPTSFQAYRPWPTEMYHHSNTSACTVWQTISPISNSK